MSTHFTYTNETAANVPMSIGTFRAMKEAVLGIGYLLNLVIVSPARMKKLNTIYRNIEKPTDILSFPLSESEGDIFICLSETKKEAVRFERTYENFLGFLFIHGCVHLKGHDHGSTMERIEVKIRKKFKI